MAYAKKLTKERLIEEGFTEITKDGRVFKGEHEVFPHWNGKEDNPNRYLCIMVYQRDSEGHLIKGKDKVCKYTRKDGTVGESNSWQAKQETFGLHRIMWAWHYGEVPEGMVVDHINNKHLCLEDYALDNLQLLTPKENLAKEREESTRMIKCNMNKPRSFYEEKLAAYEVEYEQAKKDRDAELCHSLRGNIAQTRARLRYWDAHEAEREEVNKLEAEKLEAQRLEELRLEAKRQSVKDRRLLTEWKEFFKERGNKKMWRELIRTIKAWDTLDSKQKERVFEILHKTFGSPWGIEL